MESEAYIVVVSWLIDQEIADMHTRAKSEEAKLTTYLVSTCIKAGKDCNHGPWPMGGG